MTEPGSVKVDDHYNVVIELGTHICTLAPSDARKLAWALLQRARQAEDELFIMSTAVPA